MVEIQDNVIVATQGDTVITPIELYLRVGRELEKYVPSDGDQIRFAIKSSYKDPEPIFVKTIPNDTMILRLESEDTKLLPARKKPYVYDIEITLEDGTVCTFIDRASYISTDEVY